MTNINYARRIPNRVIGDDIAAFHALDTIANYVPTRDGATPERLKAAYEAMLIKQRQENVQVATAKAAVDAARQAEVDFHEAVLSMKESVRGQFGPNSDEAQAIGYKKKSEYKRPRRLAKPAAM